MREMQNTAQEVDQLSALFEEAADLSPTDQVLYLEQLAESHPEVSDRLRRLLVQDRRLQSQSAPVPDFISDAVEAVSPGGIRLGERVGNFIVESEIGRGGMGRVVLARRADDIQQKVAIKFLRYDFAPPLASSRFAEEMQILARLEHPGIARFIDAGDTADGVPYIVMEFVDGIPIDQWCDRSDVDLDDRIDMFRQVLSALSYAHRHLVVHRDLKPANILVTAEGRAVLLDFGIAKHLVDGGVTDATITSQRFLTPKYAAPEHLAGGILGVSGDIYSAGCVLYRIISGVDPFDFSDKSAADIERIIRDIPPPSMTSRRYQVNSSSGDKSRLPAYRISKDLEHVVQRCLRKQATERYQSIDELDLDLIAVRESRPIKERKSDSLYRARRFITRNRWGVAATLGMLTALAFFLATLVEQNSRLRLERHRAASSMNLLKDSFAMANPLNFSDRSVGVRQILDAARRSMETRFKDDPALYVDMATTLAEIELALGRYDESAQLAARAMTSLSEWTRGREADKEAVELIALRAAVGAGHYERARLLLDTATPDVRQTRGWRMAEAWLLNHLGDLDQAEALLWKLVDETEDSVPYDWVAMEARQQLVLLLSRLGRTTEAQAVQAEVINWLGRYLPQDNNLVLLFRLRGLPLLQKVEGAEAAIAEGRRLISDIHRVFGPNSAMAARAHSAIGKALNSIGRASESVYELRLALQAWRQSADDDNVNVLRAMFNLAQALTQTEGAAEAAELYGLVTSRGREVLGVSNPSVLFWTYWHARFLTDRGLHEAAFDALSAASSWPVLGSPSQPLVTDIGDLLMDLMEHMRCDGRQSDRCDEARRILSSLP